MSVAVVSGNTRAHVVDGPRLILVHHGLDYQDATHGVRLSSGPLLAGSDAFESPGHSPRGCANTNEHTVGNFSSHLQHFRTSRGEINRQTWMWRRQGDFQTAQLRGLPLENATPQERRASHGRQGRSLMANDIGRAVP